MSISLTSPTSRYSSTTQNTTLSSVPTHSQAQTDSPISPFWHRFDDSTASKPSLRFSAVSSFSSQPEQPNPPTRPPTPKEPVSFSAFARRQWSRLSYLASDDTDSVVSEPASFSHSAYIASDLWLVQKDVPTAEKAISERDRRKRHKVAQEPQRSWTAEYQNDEIGSSRLIRQFFSGRNTPTVGPVRQDRREEVYGSSNGLNTDRWTGWYDRRGMDRDRFDGLQRDRFERWEDRSRYRPARDRFQFMKASPQFQEQEFGPFVRRRFSRARKLRWWLRRVTHRVRDDWEYNM